MQSNLNLDQEEVAKFDNQAQVWWDKSGPFAPLHHLNPPRVQFITDRVIVQDKTILDIGCGGGLLTESLAKRGAVVTGIDASSQLIEVAKRHSKENLLSIEYFCTTAEEFVQKKSQQFDIITCMELLEHVPSPPSLIKAAADLLKPGGNLFISTLNRNLKSYMLAIVGAEYLLNILPKGTHQYEKFIKPSELSVWLQDNHLELEDLSGLHYSPFKKSAYLNKDVSVNYIAVATRSQ